MDDLKQLIANARENTDDERELRLIDAIEKRGWLSPDEERKLHEIADR